LKQKVLITLSRAGLILLGVLASLLLLEDGFRILYPDPSPKLLNQGLQFDPTFGLAFTPNAGGWNTSLRGEYSTYVKINGKGLRGPEYPYQKEPGVYRILVLGDSFTAGLQVPQEQTFPSLLEARLRQQYPQAAIEVINAGVIGYGTDNELAYFTNEGYKYRPDLVVLALFTGNDITDNIWYSLYKLEEGELVRVEATRPRTTTPRWAAEGSLFRKVRSFLYQNSRLYSVSIELLTLSAIQRIPALADFLISMGFVEITQPSVNYGNIYAFRYLPDEAWQKTEALILELNRQVEAHHSQLLVAILPDETDVDEQRRREIYQTYAHLTKEQAINGPPPTEQMAQILESHNILHVQLLPALKNQLHQAGEPLYYRYDGHWTPAGHRVAGQAIFEYLVKHGGQLQNFPGSE